VSPSDDGSRKPQKRYNSLSNIISFIISSITSQKIERANAQSAEDDTNKQIAEWTRSVARWTRLLVIVGSITAIILFLQYCTFVKTDDAVNLQTEFQQTTERPWIKVEEISPSQGGLYYGGVNEPGFLSIHIRLKNVGLAPAFNVIAGVWPSFIYDLPPATERKNKCISVGRGYKDVTIAAANTDVISVIFPNDDFPYDGRSIVIRPEELVKQLRPDNNSVYRFWVYGCIYYLGPDRITEHQTGFAFNVAKIVAAPVPGGKASSLFNAWESVSASSILFTPMPLASGPID
jgi:hypothetical protein